MASKDEARDALIISIAKWAMSDLDIPVRIRMDVQKKMREFETLIEESDLSATD